MSKTVNFNTLNKKYLPITLNDKEKTTIMIGMPTKRIMDSLMALQANLEVVSEDASNMDVMDDLYESCAVIMSRNKMGVPVTKEKLEDVFDFEDIVVFFNAYMEFVTEAVNQKN